jgi:hypothetical protein
VAVPRRAAASVIPHGVDLGAALDGSFVAEDGDAQATDVDRYTDRCLLEPHRSTPAAQKSRHPATAYGTRATTLRPAAAVGLGARRCCRWVAAGSTAGGSGTGARARTEGSDAR